MKAITQNLESIAILLAIGAFAAYTLGWPSAEGLIVITASALAFYYLASGVLVLLDKVNVERIMRIMWFLGMWALAMVVLGAMATVLRWPVADTFLMCGAGGTMATVGFTWLNRQGMDTSIRDAYDTEIRPLARRLLGGSAVAAMFWFVA